MESTVKDRFWNMVDKNGPIPKDHPELGNCYPWLGFINKGGYGMMWGRNSKELAHRIAYWLETGKDAPEQVQHLCNNRACVRFSHFDLGDHAKNAHYMAVCGRANPPRGEDHYDHKLTEEIVREARRRYIPGRIGRTPKDWPKGTTCRELAKEYGVSEHVMSLALRGLTWKHVK